MHEDLVKAGDRVDLLAKDGQLVSRILSFDVDNVHRTLLQRIFHVLVGIEEYDLEQPLCS
jgi:hypothetical protein